MARPIVDQKIMTALPNGLPGRGLNGVVNISIHTSSVENGSTARSRVIRVVSSRLLPHGIVEENANGPGEIGQYVSETFEGSGLGGRIF